MSHSRKSKGREYWVQVIQEWEASGLSGSQFCIQRGINQSVFHRWKHKIKSTTEKKN